MGKSCLFFLSNLRQHGGEDLQSQVFLITQPGGAALQNPGLIVQALHEAQGRATVVPQLPAGFFEQVSGVEAFVRGEQQLLILAGTAGGILRLRQQGIFFGP